MLASMLGLLDLLIVGTKFTRPACRATALDRYLLPAPDVGSKPTGRCCCCRSTGQTDEHPTVIHTLLHTLCGQRQSF